MFNFLANIFGYVLNFVYGLVNNYGLAIIIFTILLRVILLPMNLKQQKTMKKSAKLQVKMKELQDKYSNDPTRLNEEVKNLYVSEHMNPLSGCLSSILQIIIIISIFYLVSNPLTYMRRLNEYYVEKEANVEDVQEMKIDEKTEEGENKQSLIEYYIEQINKDENKELGNYREISVIKYFGNDSKINIDMNFLGLNLSDVPSKDYQNPTVFIIPVLYIVTSIISMRLSTPKKKKKQVTEEANKEDEKLVKVNNHEEEDAMESMSKTMRYMMPIMTVSIAIIAPLGLALYWLINNIFMIGERLLINKLVKSEE